MIKNNSNESQKLLKHLNESQKNYISDFYSSLSNEMCLKSIHIEPAIISLFGPLQIFFSIFITSYYLADMNFEVFLNLNQDI